MLGKRSTGESIENSALITDAAAYKSTRLQIISAGLMISHRPGAIIATSLAIHVRSVGNFMANLKTGKAASKERRIVGFLLPMKPT